MFLQFSRQFAELRFSDQLVLQNAIAHVLEELPKDRTSVVPVRIDVDRRVHFDIHQPGFTEQAMRSAANKKVTPVSGRVSSENLEKTVPGWKGRVAEV